MELLKTVLAVCLDTLVNVTLGLFMIMMWALALYIYLNKEEFFLGSLASTLLGLVTCIIIYALGKGVKDNW